MSTSSTTPMGHILIYIAPGCPHCLRWNISLSFPLSYFFHLPHPLLSRAEDVLHSKNVSFFVVNLNSHPSLHDDMVEKSGAKTVPQIFFGEVKHQYNDNQKYRKTIFLINSHPFLSLVALSPFQEHIGGASDLLLLEEQLSLDSKLSSLFSLPPLPLPKFAELYKKPVSNASLSLGLLLL